MNSIIYAALCPHPPIVIPEVAKNNFPLVKQSVEGLAALAKQLVEKNPEIIVLVTPHAVMYNSRFTTFQDPTLYGDFQNFGTNKVLMTFENDLEFLDMLEKTVDDPIFIPLKIKSGTKLDHGSCVPLYYLQKAGFQGKIVIFNYTWLSSADHIHFGELINTTGVKLNKKIGFIASGDLSHRLKPEAPAGYEPNAHIFDNAVHHIIERGTYNDLQNIDWDLRKLAGECGYNSLMVALGVVKNKLLENHIFSYDAPFGVGYLTASL